MASQQYPSARLSRDLERVLCARPTAGRCTCHGELASVHSGPTTLADIEAAWASADPDLWPHLVFFERHFRAPLGFSKGADGIWALCRYSAAHWQHQRRRQSREGGRSRDDSRYRYKPYPKYRRGDIADQGSAITEVSCLARCPECGLVQWLTPALLDHALPLFDGATDRRYREWLAMLPEGAPRDRKTFTQQYWDAHRTRQEERAAALRAAYIDWQRRQPPESPLSWASFSESSVGLENHKVSSLQFAVFRRGIESSPLRSVPYEVRERERGQLES